MAKGFHLVKRCIEFDCSFRAARDTDFSALSLLASHCWHETYDRVLPALSAKRFDDERGGEDYARCLLPVTQVAVVENEIVGMIANTFGIVTGLYVDDRFRRNRIGSSLLHNAYLKGADTLSVVSSNNAAVSFYERCGWVRWQKIPNDVFGAEVVEDVMVARFRPHINLRQPITPRQDRK